MTEQTTTVVPGSAKARRTWRLTAALIATFGSLMVLGMLVVLGVSLWIAILNTSTLLRDKADSVIDMLEVQVEEHLAPVPEALSSMAKHVEDGIIDPNDTAAMRATFVGTLAAVPQLMGIGMVGVDFQGLFAGRSPTGLRFGTPDFRNDPVVRAQIPKLEKATTPQWTAPVWRDLFVDTLLVATMPMRKSGKVVGGMVAMVRVRELSDYLNKIGARSGVVPFILYGRDRVLAHPNLMAGFKGSNKAPLPGLAEIGDPVIARMWDPAVRDTPMLPARPPVKNHLVEIGGVDYLVFFKEVRGYGPKPWTIGVHVEARVFGDSLIRLAIGAGVGLFTVILAVIVALMIGRRIASPVQRLADAAHLVGQFQLDAVEPLPRSGIREINDQSTAFNSMVGGLRWFGTYVPKGLVRQLLVAGEVAIESDNRHLTVMFTDIVGFSTFSEDRPAAEVAEFLNEHFAIVAGCIEAEGGTVDKFIGDSVMAFWGAPDKQKDRAVRACRSALAIRKAIAAENKRRIAAGKEPVRVRIGMHSGHATVGNIGSPDRLNYTAIGDMVNVAQRMEQLGKELVPDGGEVTVLITDATLDHLNGHFEVRSLGRHTVKGRDEAVEVFELVSGPSEPVPEPEPGAVTTSA